MIYIFFFFNDPATTEIYTLSLHDALPILIATDAVVSLVTSIIKISVFGLAGVMTPQVLAFALLIGVVALPGAFLARSEEHTSELQSQSNLVCRLLLEKKKKHKKNIKIQNK